MQRLALLVLSHPDGVTTAPVIDAVTGVDRMPEITIEADTTTEPELTAPTRTPRAHPPLPGYSDYCCEICNQPIAWLDDRSPVHAPRD